MRLVSIAGLAIAAIACAGLPISAADFPEWAYPGLPKTAPFDAKVMKHLPGSTKEYTQAQIEDDFNPPDWFPQDHPPMPPVVAHGVTPNVRACAKCHVSNGAGHPESSDLAGLPSAYIAHQIVDFKSGKRKGHRAGAMFPIAKTISDADLEAAADYYSALKPIEWTKVVEAKEVPKSHLATGGMRFADDHAGQEPLGNRIIELPQDASRAELRDSRVGFIAYVPVGSVAKGKLLVTSGGGKTLPCSACHGANLQGQGVIPHLAGRSPTYVFRQLNDMQAGTRTGAMAGLMKGVVAKLSPEDMIDIAAYLASLKP